MVGSVLLYIQSTGAVGKTYKATKPSSSFHFDYVHFLKALLRLEQTLAVLTG